MHAPYALPSFETPPSAAPQDEVESVWFGQMRSEYSRVGRIRPKAVMRRMPPTGAIRCAIAPYEARAEARVAAGTDRFPRAARFACASRRPDFLAARVPGRALRAKYSAPHPPSNDFAGPRAGAICVRGSHPDYGW